MVAIASFCGDGLFAGCVGGWEWYLRDVFIVVVEM